MGKSKKSGNKRPPVEWSTKELIQGALKEKEIDSDGLLEECRSNNRLMDALDYCFANNITPPYWLTGAFQQALDDVRRHKKSWNEVFGNPLPKAEKRHKQREALKLHEELALPVYRKVREFQAQNKAVDYHKIAAELLGATEAIAKRVYYKNKDDNVFWELMVRLGQETLQISEAFEQYFKQLNHDKDADLELVAKLAFNLGELVTARLQIGIAMHYFSKNRRFLRKTFT